MAAKKRQVKNLKRDTAETKIELSLNLDGEGKYEIETGVGFFDHMLCLFTRHGLFDMELVCKGDLEVDIHHSVEDVGIVLGQAFAETVGDKAGMTRFGTSYVPMDETLARVSVDMSGRPYLVFNADIQREKIGGQFDTEVVADFFKAFSDNAKINLHIDLLRGKNSHHNVEAIFKACARALSQAVTLNPRIKGANTTKDML